MSRYASITDTVGATASMKPAKQCVVSLNCYLDHRLISANIRTLGSPSQDPRRRPYYDRQPNSLDGSVERAYSLFEGNVCFTYNEHSAGDSGGVPKVLSALNGLGTKIPNDPAGTLDYDSLLQKVKYAGIAQSYIEYEGYDTKVQLDVALQTSGTDLLINNNPQKFMRFGDLVRWRFPRHNEANQDGVYRLILDGYSEAGLPEMPGDRHALAGNDVNALTKYHHEIALTTIGKALSSAAPGQPFQILLF